jgi:hypothetical protein
MASRGLVIAGTATNHGLQQFQIVVSVANNPTASGRPAAPIGRF